MSASEADRVVTAARRLEHLLNALTVTVSAWPVVASIGLYGFAPIPDAAFCRVRCEALEDELKLQTVHRNETFPIISIFGGWDDDTSKQAEIGQRLQLQLMFSGQTEAEMVAMVRGAMAEAARSNELIGGPIHVAVVDANGARWVEGGR